MGSINDIDSTCGELQGSANPITAIYRAKGARNRAEERHSPLSVADGALVREMVTCCHENGSNILTLVATAWSIVLQRFAEVDQAQVIVQQKGKRQLMTTDLAASSTIQDLLRPQQWAFGGSTADGEDVPFPIQIVVDDVDTPPTGLDQFMSHCPLALIARTQNDPQVVVVLHSSELRSCEIHMRNLASTLQSAIQSTLAAKAQRLLAEIDCLSSEHRQLIQAWNSAGLEKPRTRFLHQHIHEMARQRPDAFAVDAPDKRLTYRALDGLSSALAVHLASLGVNQGMLVGISFHKSAWAIVSMLAVNKLGAGFVPLDTSHPSDRLKHIINEARISFLLASAQTSGAFVEMGVKTVIPQNCEPQLSLCGDNNSFPCAADPDDPAYCLFTSGSTGVPKGCLVSHEALASVSEHTRALFIGSDSRVLQFASFSFGISLIEIWCTLTAGATVCMIGDKDRLDNLAGAISDLKVDWAFMTATVVGALKPQDVPGLRTIVVAGEPLQKSQIMLWSSAVRLMQGYGLTEWAGVCSVSAPITSPGDEKNIGRPAKAHFWLAEPGDAQRLAPVGAIAELIIEGPSLAKGYLNQADSTAAVFLQAPKWSRRAFGSSFCSSTGHRRFYRTGDLVQYNCDGSLSYIGRKDTQVKIRGQRVETREVELAVTKYLPAARKVIIEGITFGEGEGQQALVIFIHSPHAQMSPVACQDGVAFLAMDKGLKREIDSCKKSLQQHLPSYMVPEHFLAIADIPITVTGKVDRRRLREQTGKLSRKQLAVMAGLQKEPQPPSTTQERILCDAVTEVLKADPADIGINCSFFELGGDSVAAMKLVGLARTRGLQVTVNDIFRSPVLQDLAQRTRIIRARDPLIGMPEPFALVDSHSRHSVMLTAAQQCALATDQIEDIYPCTPLQEGMFSLSEGIPGEYLVEVVYQLHDGVDAQKLKSAWEATVLANPVLRSRIINAQAHGVFQVVVQEEFQWEEGVNLAQCLEQWRSRPVVLGGRLLHAAVIQEPPGPQRKRYLAAAMHHSICDRWSVQLIMNNLEAAYHGQALEKRVFSIFVDHLRQARGVKEFWTSELEGWEPQVFPNVQQKGGRTVSLSKSKKSVRYDIRLPACVLSEHTLPTVLRLALALAIRSHTRVNDVIYGTTVTGRGAPVPYIETMGGPTIATIPVRVRIDPRRSLAEVLSQTQDDLIRVLPFEQAGLQNIRKYDSNAEAACQFQTHLIVQPAIEKTATSILTPVIERTAALSGCALTLICEIAEDSRAITVDAQFDTLVLDQTAVLRVLHQFRHFLEKLLVTAPSTPVQALFAGLSHEDMDQLQDWNSKAITGHKECIHDAISVNFTRQPHSLAVCSWDGEFTYGDIDKLSGRLSAMLQELSTKPEEVIALCFEKSCWTIVAMLAVLRAGAAFVLLEPAYPVARLQDMCRESSCRIIITSPENEPLSKGLSMEQMIVLDKPRMQGASTTMGSCETAKQGLVRPANAAYLIYTSGSTGKPKGIIVEHHNYVSAARAHLAAFGINSSSRVLQFSPYAFDVCITEMMGTLIAGGCVCILSESQRRDSFLSSVTALRLTHAMLTPSFARTLVGEESIRFTETLILLGEKVTTTDIQQWDAHYRLINAYGPAECSVIATVQNKIHREANAANIGYGTGCIPWIVDPQDHETLMPVGAVGELLIEGPIVARCYGHDPLKTAGAFISAPDWLRHLRRGEDRGRIYKTGDLVRYEGDGSLLYCGRSDTQVKLRAQRFELSEVETHIQACSDLEISDVVAEVVSPSAPSMAPYLVAFIARKEPCDAIIATPDAAFSQLAQAVESRLQQRLPNYMIPSLFVPLGRIPCTPSGKTDRRFLRAHLATASDEILAGYRFSPGTKSAPRTGMERTLQRMWSILLGIPLARIGSDDSFFRLGGDSLAAMSMVGLAREAGLILTVADIFNHRVLSELAQVVRVSSDSDTAIDVAPSPFSLLESAEDLMDARATAVSQCHIPVDLIEDILPCTPLQEGLISVSSRQPWKYVSRSVLDLRDGVEPAKLQRAFDQVVSANPIWRTRIVEAGGKGKLFQVVVRKNIEWSTGHAVAEFLSQDALRPMGLGAPLIRFAMIPNQGRSQLVLTVHHAVYDGMSIQLLLEQLEVAYRRGPLPPVPPFGAFIRYVSNVTNKEEFWKSQFADLNAAVFPSLPAGGYTPTPSTKLRYPICALQQEAGEHTVALKMRLALSIVLAQYTGSDDVVFGVTVNGRSVPVQGIERMTGPTIATLPLRVKLDPQVTVEMCLSALQNTLTELVTYEQTGIQNIRRYGREAATACEFQTHLVVQPPNETNSNGLISPAPNSPAQLEGYVAHALYALSIFCEPSNVRNDLDLVVHFDEKTISQPRVLNFLGLLEHVLRQLCSNPEIKLGAIDLVSPRDREQLAQWNTVLPPSHETTLHQMVLDVSRCQPTRTAVTAWDGELSYMELDNLSAKLARSLVERGLKIGDLVGVCLEKSRWAPVTLLGVLRAGGACVMLDPGLPRKRIVQMSKRASLTVVLATEAQRCLVEGLDTPVTLITEQFMYNITPREGACLPSVPPSSVSFVLFTSGSTGTPKALMLQHRNLCTSIRAHRSGMNVSGERRGLHFAAYSFDVSIYEIFNMLSCGGCVCIPSETQRINGLAEFIVAQQVNWALLTPSAASVLRPEDVPCLQTMVLAGEAVQQDNVDVWAGRVTLVNAYGPAETFFCTVGPIPPREWISGTIGSMTGGISWVCQPSDPSKLSPIGTIGELVIEGAVVGPGYLNDVERTRASFLEGESLPAWIWRFRQRDKSQPRLYLSGDLVQYNVDGTLRFMGRKDSQTKLRGQRIELGEVETWIQRTWPGAVDVVAEVVAPDSFKNGASLVAFIHQPGGERLADKVPLLRPPAEAFHEHTALVTTSLRTLLPRYMVPSTFIPVNYMPRTATGKKNRRLLREECARLSREDFLQYRASRGDKGEVTTETEEILQRIWARVLSSQVEDIGVHDDFFQLGGDSISAMTMAANARSEGLSLTVADLFDTPSLGKLATRAESKVLGRDRVQATPFSLVQLHDSADALVSDYVKTGRLPRGGEVADVLPLTESQTFFTQWPLVNFAFYFVGPLDVERLQQACGSVFTRHEILRTVFIPYQERIVQVILRDISCPFEHVANIEDMADAIKEVNGRDAGRHVTQVGLPLRFTVLSGSRSEHVFNIRISHAQYDGVCLSPFINEIQAAYNEPQNLAAAQPETDFSTLVYYRHQKSNEDAFGFWRRYLAGSRITLPHNLLQLSQRDGERTMIIQARNMPAPSPPQGFTAAALITAATAVALSQIHDSRSLVLGQTVNARTLPLANINRIMGPCLNFIPMRLDMQRDWTVMHLLRHIRHQNAQTIRYDYVHFRDTVEKSTPWARNTQFGYMIQHQNVEHKITMSLGGMESGMGGENDFDPIDTLWIFTIPDKENLEVRIQTRSHVASEEQVSSLLDNISRFIALFSKSPDRQLSDLFESS